MQDLQHTTFAELEARARQLRAEAMREGGKAIAKAVSNVFARLKSGTVTQQA